MHNLTLFHSRGSIGTVRGANWNNEALSLVPDLTCVRPTPASTLGSPGRRGRGLPAVGPGKRAPGLIRIPDALLASIAVRPGARDRFVGSVYNGNHLFA